MRPVLLVLFLVLLSACARPRELVVLLPDADQAGQVTIAPQAGPPQTLTTPYAALETTRQGAQGQTLLPARVAAIFGALPQRLPAPAQTFTLHFDTGGTRLAESAQATVLALLAAVTARGVAEVEITGHTDTVGDSARNDALALERATITQRLLEAAGLPETFVRVVGRGERDLLVPTPDETAEPRNRRVEVVVR